MIPFGLTSCRSEIKLKHLQLDALARLGRCFSFLQLFPDTQLIKGRCVPI